MKVILFLTILFGAFFASAHSTLKSAQVSVDSLRLYSELPRFTAKTVLTSQYEQKESFGKLANGSEVKILSETVIHYINGQGVWFKVLYQSDEMELIGYVFSHYKESGKKNLELIN